MNDTTTMTTEQAWAIHAALTALRVPGLRVAVVMMGGPVAVEPVLHGRHGCVAATRITTPATDAAAVVTALRASLAASERAAARAARQSRIVDAE